MGSCSNLFRDVRSFENWEIFLDIPQFLLGNIRSGDVFGPIARERKYLMGYKGSYDELFDQSKYPILIITNHLWNVPLVTNNYWMRLRMI